MGGVERIVVIERPVLKRPYNHFGETWEVYYPKLLFFYRLRETKVKTAAVAAVLDEIIKDNTRVFYFPFGNVFKDHRLCMGTYKFPPINELAELTYQPEQWYLIEHDHIDNACGQKIINLLKLAKEKPLDEGQLQFACTYKKWLENLIGKTNQEQ